MCHHVAYRFTYYGYCMLKFYLGHVISCYTAFSEIPKWCAPIPHQHNTLYTSRSYLFVVIRILQMLTYFAEIKELYIKKCSFLLLSESVFYRGADKSLARPGRKQANVSVKMA